MMVMKIKLPSLVRSCVGPSPTTDDAPSTSSSRRHDTPPAGPTPATRNRGAAGHEAQRPRQSLITKLGKGIKNAPHAIAVRTGISQSRRAAAANSGGGAPQGSQVPPGQAPAAGVNLWDLLEHQGRMQAALSQGQQLGRSPGIISLQRNAQLPATIFNEVQQPAVPPVPVEPVQPVLIQPVQFEPVLIQSVPIEPVVIDSEPVVEPRPLPQATQRTHLPSRREALAAAATQVLRQAHLPQAASTLANTSLTRELAATANTMLEPLRIAANTGSTLAQAGSSWLNRPRQSSQALQQALQGDGVDLSRRENQTEAHSRAVEYGEHAATVLDAALPAVHSILKIGVAGTAMAFGAGRNTGLAAGDALGRLERGAPQATGVRAGPEPAASTLPSGTAFKLLGAGAQQWLLGSITGAVGNTTGQYLAAPLVNLIPRQFAPIDLRAVLPDETVELMNELQPGAGDRLRTQVQEAQRDVASINSASNVRLGQIAFDAITAGRFVAQGGLPLGVAGQVGIGLAVSSSAGMVIGAVMAARQSVASHEIPDLAALQQAVAAHRANPGGDGAAALAEVGRKAVPLFFPRQTAAAAEPPLVSHDIETGGDATVANADEAQQDRLASMRDTARWAGRLAVRPLAAVGQAWSQALGASPLIEPAAPGTDGAITTGRVLQTASNVAASVVNRAGEMAKATLTTSLMSTGSAMLASATDGPARQFILAAGNAVGIHAAIKPWFDSLASAIPQGDARIRAHREQVAGNPPPA
jgi:hypothetical protein